MTEDQLHHPVTSINLSQDENCVLASCTNNRIVLIDKSSGEVLQQYQGHQSHNYKIDCSFSNDDGFVISGSEDKQIFIWELVEGKIHRRLQGHSGVVCSLSLHHSSSLMASSSSDGYVNVWT